MPVSDPEQVVLRTIKLVSVNRGTADRSMDILTPYLLQSAPGVQSLWNTWLNTSAICVAKDREE